MSKKTRILLAVLLGAALMLGLSTFAGATAGEPDVSWYNTSDTAFTLSTAEELAGFAQIVNGTADGIAADTFQNKTITLGGNVDLSAFANWTPIGDASHMFAGAFYGAGYTVSGLSISAGGETPVDTAGYYGLFGNISNRASIGSLTLSGTVSVAYSAGIQYVGGVVGYSQTGSFTNILTDVSVSVTRADGSSAASYAGGLAGYVMVNSGNTTGCVNTGAVTGPDSVGGLLGYFRGSSNYNLTGCYNTGSVTGGGYAGGLVGTAEAQQGRKTTVTECYNVGAVTGPTGQAGEIIGISTGRTNSSNPFTVTRCYCLKDGLSHVGSGYVAQVSNCLKLSADRLRDAVAAGLLTSNYFKAGPDYPILTWQTGRAHTWETEGTPGVAPSGVRTVTYACEDIGCEAERVVNGFDVDVSCGFWTKTLTEDDVAETVNGDPVYTVSVHDGSTYVSLTFDQPVSVNDAAESYTASVQITNGTVVSVKSGGYLLYKIKFEYFVSDYTVTLTPSVTEARSGDEFTVDVVVGGGAFKSADIYVNAGMTCTDVELFEGAERIANNNYVVISRRGEELPSGTKLATITLQVPMGSTSFNAIKDSLIRLQQDNTKVTEDDTIDSTTPPVQKFQTSVQITPKLPLTFRNDTGTVELATVYVWIGEKPSIEELPEIPTDLGHECVGWQTRNGGVVGETLTNEQLADVTVNTYNTYYAACLYNITFLDGDGTTVLQEKTSLYGEVPVYTGETVPTKEPTAQYTYTFRNYSTQKTTRDWSYTPSFNRTTNQYTVTFVDYDGTEISSALYNYLTSPENIVKPADPTRDADAQYTYTFAGWTPAFAYVTQDATYTATYEATPVPVVTITTQPEDYTGRLGDEVSFTVEATGEGLSYQWQFSSDGGATWKNSGLSGNDTATLSMTFTEARMIFRFRCVVTDAGGNSVRTNIVRLIRG